MNDVILAALDIAGYALRTASINVQLDLAPDIPLVDADADQLHQVLLNLLINAQQSLREQGLPRRIVVTSRLDARADRLLVTVADNGPGIPAHLRARVFEPYFTTKPVGVGTGVGLAVSLGIVEAHGGTITVNEAPAGGAAFVIALPVGAVPAIGSDAVPAAASPAQGHAVLIVDDEAEIRETLAEILAGPQHRVVAVASAREALQRMAVERYDVIFTDIRMPGLDGRALYRKIEERWPELAERVVFVTGDTLTAGLRDFVSETGRRVVEKPFLPSDVRRVMAELMVD
jgi:CheY-like chemotaxis protein